jgi:hypothetical protein
MIVYKYTNRLEVLETSCLRFTQPDQLNDPLESHPDFRELIEDIKNRKDLRPRLLQRSSTRLRKMLPRPLHQRSVASI